ncbi:hypothetical protein HGRIS_004045 [Hohenbuehelia grisea]|uniref:Methyltransferase-domain-containing protein n=1 Tax=Hohenbuehelia grisea TaxID=104357 RepID=A0ABR3JHX9_9AGAR
MYFYLSFLRPPPVAAPLSGAVPFTPQIANDLRTELLDAEQDIFYTWVESSSGSAGPGSVISTTAQGHAASLAGRTKLQKLTVWRPLGAYKELKVPPPPRVREGQCWRLLLSATLDPSHTQAIRLNIGNICGKVPFPVLSMPIVFTARSAKFNAKQESVERVYSLGGVRSLQDGAPSDEEVILKVTEQTSFDLDKKIWDSGIGLSSWVTALHDAGPGTHGNLHTALFSEGTRHILELGAGTGIVSLVLAALRTASLTPGAEHAQILTTDLPSAMPLLEQNIKTNSRCFSTSPPQAAVLDWDEPLPESILATQGLDAIIMADVTYNTAAFPSLIRTLEALIRLGPQPPLVLLGYKERDEGERTLWDLAREIGLEFERIGERPGAGGAPVEIWLGSVQAKSTT